MRLIDANKLKREDLCDICLSADCGNCFSNKNFEDWIASQPTAYDIDKIVEQLKQLSIGTVLCDKCEYREKCDDIQEKYNPDDDTDLCTMVAKSLAIEIVKGGA